MKISQNVFCEISKKYRPKYEYKSREEWKFRGRRMNFPRAFIPEDVKRAIHDVPEEMLTSKRYEDEISKTTVIGYDKFRSYVKPNLKKLLIQTDPVMSGSKLSDAFLFDQYSRFEFGQTQASILTKTVKMDSTISLFPVDLPVNCRQILERFVLKANWWITDEDRFPKRFSRTKHIFNYKLEFGISIKNTIRYFLKDLFEYCEHISDSNNFRLLNKDHSLETFYHWDNRRIQFKEIRDFVISSQDPLSKFERKTINWDNTNYLNTIGPVDPCIDLKLINYYPLENCDGWEKANVIYFHPHLITINMDLPNIHINVLEPEGRQITQSQKNAIGIMNCFAQSVATARRLFGNEIVDTCKEKLPYPVCVHAISFDGVQFDFISYQLNSTDFSDKSCANLVWIDEKNKLFNKLYNLNGMLRNTRYENLNIDVFKKFLQYYQYGLHK